MLLLKSTQTLQLKLGGAVATNECTGLIGYADIRNDASTVAPSSSSFDTTSGTAVNIATSPAAGFLRQLKYLSLYNADTAPVDVTVQVDDASTVRVICTVQLEVGGRVEYVADVGFRVYTATGAPASDFTIDWGEIGGTLSDQTDLQAALDAKQPLDSDLTAIAGLSPSNDDFIQRKAGAWTNRTIAQVKSDLSLSGTNSGDQTSIVGITGTLSEFNAALTGADFATGGGTATGTNTGDQTSVSGNAGTATALATARAIGGINFDGTAAIEPGVSEVAVTTGITLGLTHRNKILTQTHASPQTIAIPAQSSVTWVGPTTIIILAYGAGTCTLDADTGVTLNGVSGGAVALNRYQNAVLRWISSDTWVVSGTSADVA
jgi:hypothetical protein